MTDLAHGDMKSSHSFFCYALSVTSHKSAIITEKWDSTPTYAAGKAVLHGKLATLCVR